jgi:molybdopterin molybdotransferase
VLSFDEARKRVLALAPRLCAERVGLDDACGRVLAGPVLAPADMPAFDYSAMDGYAVRTTDWPNGAHSLPVSGESRAGSGPFALLPGTACRIFTGAPVPDGADAVVMQENVDRDGDAALFRDRPKPGAHIRRRGEDLAAGSLAIAAGTRLRPSHVGLAASCDRAWLDVARRPVVALIGTGDELRPPGLARPGGGFAPGSIPESNGPALRAIATRAGAHARVLPFAPDDRAEMLRAFEGALHGTDLLVSIGGVSVGDHDLVRPVLEELGAEIDFWKVAIKPGKPLLVGRRGDAVVLGLPGNPASAMITFALFGVPLLRAMQGDLAPLPAPMRARLSKDVAHQPGRLELLRASVISEGDGLVATPLGNQASGASTSMAEADALVCIDAERGAVKSGEVVDILWLDDLCA